jgi:hypothetical protein
MAGKPQSGPEGVLLNDIKPRNPVKVAWQEGLPALPLEIVESFWFHVLVIGAARVLTCAGLANYCKSLYQEDLIHEHNCGETGSEEV